MVWWFRYISATPMKASDRNVTSSLDGTGAPRTICSLRGADQICASPWIEQEYRYSAADVSHHRVECRTLP